MYVSDVALLAIIQRAVTLIGEQVRKTQNGVQGRAQLVAHCREELILELAAALNFLFRKQDGLRKLFNLLLGSFKLRSAFPDPLLHLTPSHSQTSLLLL